ncbi:MAG: TolC family outer membrane protein, partial [Geminicoccaceae bacterium]|nr:TolC family outer membrane protein [Geminicoccaceae bacterium]
MGNALRAALAVGLLAATHQPGGAQTLEEALVSAYLTNPELEAQRAALRATDELVPEALSDWRPNVRVDGSAVAADIDSPNAKGQLSTLTGSLVVDQDIYRGGETVANTSRAEALVRLERARLQAIEQDVLLDAVVAYTDLLTALAVLELAIQNENRLERQLQATRDRFEVGEVTRTDVAQAQARLAGAVSDRTEAEGAIRSAEATFRAVINEEPVRLTAPAPLTDLPPREEEAQELAQSFNPNIAAAQFDLQAAEWGIDVAESALLPRLSVRGELTYTEEPSFALDRQRVASVGANLTVPLYQGGGEYARVRQSKHTFRQRREDLETAYRLVREEVTDAWQTMMTATATIESISEQVRAAEIALEGARQEALVGQRTVLDVLDQEQDLFTAEVDLVRAQRAQIIASYRVKAAIGQLTAEGVGLPVEPYDPSAHYERVRDRWFGLGPDIEDDQ